MSFLIPYLLCCIAVSTIATALRPIVNDLEQRDDKGICAYFSASSASIFCHQTGAICQIATAISPTVIFCGTINQIPATTRLNYNGGSCNGPNCCPSDQPSAYKAEFNGAATVYYGCGLVGNIFTAAAVTQNLLTVAGQTSTSITRSSSPLPTSSASASGLTTPTITSPPTKSSASATASSPPASTETGSSSNNESGLSKASEIGSIIGSIFGFIAIVVAIYYGYKAAKVYQNPNKEGSSTKLNTINPSYHPIS